MSKNKGGGDNPSFENRACKRFRENKNIGVMSQSEIFEILDEDLETILGQITDSRQRRGKYPRYAEQMFVNLSVPYYFYKYAKKHIKTKKGEVICKKLDADALESMRQLIASVYRLTFDRNNGMFNGQILDADDRNKYLLRTFHILSEPQYKVAKKLGLSRKDTEALIIQIYGKPEKSMSRIHTKFSDSSISEKKKLKIFKKLYGDRFVQACGCVMCMESTRSDFISTIFNYVNKHKKKKRAKFLKAYADAFKHMQCHNYQVNAQFAHDNRKLIDGLLYLDVGYRKAFRNLKGDKNPKKDKEKEKSPDKKDKKPWN